MANVKIVFDSGKETVVAVPETLATRVVADFAKFSNGGDMPAHRFQVQEDTSFFVDFRKVSMIMNSPSGTASATPERRSKRA